MSQQRSRRVGRTLGLLSLVLGTLVVAACGGGGGTSDTASATPKSTFATGTITGFGSIVVNGVHYRDDVARVADEDGELRGRDDLKLGMVVEIRGGEITAAGGVEQADAREITMSSLIRGPVEAVTATGMVVLGQTVNVTPTTVFQQPLTGGLAAITVGMPLRIYGTLDASTGVYTATRVEPQGGDASYRLRGVVAALDPIAHTIRIGGALIDVSGVTLPQGLAVGSMVRVKVRTTQANGAWVAISVKPGVPRPDDHDHAEVEGTVTDFRSALSFSVDGLVVDASHASFDGGMAAIVAGARVEVEGTIVNGVLVATKVKIEGEAEREHAGFEVEGAITAANAATSSFVVRGVSVGYTGSVQFVGGTAADLKPGARVEVRAALAADRMTLAAVEIRFDH